MSPSRIDPPPRTVILWVHPRSTSTMFECALLQRASEFRVLHEPLGDAYYWGPERVSKRYAPETCKKDYAKYRDSTYEKVWSNIVCEQPATAPQRTFSKDMAQYIFPAPDPSTPPSSLLVPTDALLSPTVHHTFLIRTPYKAIPSYHRLCYPSSPTGFEYWDPAEAGFREERLLFDLLRAEGRVPLVIDSEDLLRDPEGTMRMWCEDSGIEFDKEMLSWDEGTREHFEKWSGFHEAAENSTGVGKGLKKEHCADPRDDSAAGQPQEVRDAIQANLADYEHLRQFVRRA